MLLAQSVADPQGLSAWCDVDGKRQQDGHTKDMVFSVAEVVRYLSQFATLEPGDVIVTGTPAGVAMGQTPPPFLQPGQVITCGIDGLGEQRRQCVSYK